MSSCPDYKSESSCTAPLTGCAWCAIDSSHGCCIAGGGGGSCTCPIPDELKLLIWQIILIALGATVAVLICSGAFYLCCYRPRTTVVVVEESSDNNSSRPSQQHQHQQGHQQQSPSGYQSQYYNNQNGPQSPVYGVPVRSSNQH